MLEDYPTGFLHPTADSSQNSFPSELPLPIWRDLPFLNLYHISCLSPGSMFYSTLFVLKCYVYHHPTPPLPKIRLSYALRAEKCNYNSMFQHFMDNNKSKSCMYITYWPTRSGACHPQADDGDFSDAPAAGLGTLTSVLSTVLQSADLGNLTPFFGGRWVGRVLICCFI